MRALTLPPMILLMVANGGTVPLGAAAASSVSSVDRPALAKVRSSRLFFEPMVPAVAAPDERESGALAQALDAFARAGHLETQERVRPLLEFLKTFSDSTWRGALLLNLGQHFQTHGYVTRALEAYRAAWATLKQEKGEEVRPLADRALAEQISLLARLGQQPELEALLLQADQRPLTGTAAEKIGAARAGLWIMQNRPEHAFVCGLRALETMAQIGHQTATREDFEGLRPGPKGTNLQQLLSGPLAHRLGLQAVKRSPGASWLAPAILHWKQGHFSVLLEVEGNACRVLDPVFGAARWISRAALEEETSGYQLIAKASMLPDWNRVSPNEAALVWGRGYSDNGPDDGCGRGGSGGPCNSCGGGPGGGGPGGGGPGGGGPGGGGPGGGGPGGGDGPGDGAGGPPMATYTGYIGAVSLAVSDTPVGYAPPRGPAMGFTVGYYQRDARYPQTPNFSNLGSRWSFSWTCYLLETMPAGASVPSAVELHRGLDPKSYLYTDFDATTKTSAPQFFRHDRMVLRADGSYELQRGNGSKEIYSFADGTTSPRRLFMTQLVDAAGNAATLGYDAQFRLVTITDALQQVTTLSYEAAGRPYFITQITDPFGRIARFTYDGNGRLEQITDVIGLKSTFTYGDGVSADFMTTLTTPYGTHAFTKGESGTTRWLEAVDPLGSRERWEFRHQAPGIPYNDPQAPVGAGNWDNWYRNGFFWNKRAMALYPGDYTKAEIYQFLHIQTPNYSNVASPLLQSRKLPLENRDWYFYPGQASYRGPHWVGTSSLPSRIARMLPGGIEQNRTFEYNAWGKTTKITDPAGRQTSYVYSADGIDLLEVRNTSASGNDLLATYTFNAQHRPLTAVDAAGKTTTYTYNGFGQVLTITNPRNETTTFSYDPQGYLGSITGPVTGTTTGFTYDSKGRVRTVTAPEGETTTTDYDDIDRPTLVTHADASTEQMAYDRLDLWKSKDRANRWTYMTYNPLRQLVEIQDPLGRITRFDWCGCGSQLEGLTDPKGQYTTWLRDLGGRVISKLLADGSSTRYGYDSAGRLAERTDAMGQRTLYTYEVDNNLLSVSYPNALKPTPSASYTYDPKYNRLATSTGAFGTTSYTYNPITTPPAAGAGRLAAVAGPFPNSTISYTYDELGRVQSRGINGVQELRGFDALGRVESVANALGVFTYLYDGATSRLNEVRFPNGQKTAFGYYDGSGERRLQSIDHRKSDDTSLSRFAYTYNGDGQIHTWSQGTDAQLPKVWTFTYDAVQQLTGALLNGPNGALIRQFTYGYDLMGNRTSESVDGATTTATHNSTNQLTGQRHALDTAAIIRRQEEAAARRKAKARSGPVAPTR